MLRRLALSLSFACALCCLLPGFSAGAVLSGNLSVNDGGILAGGDWNDPNTALSWEVTDPAQTPSGKWRYRYAFTAPGAGAARLLVELRFQVLIGDLVNKSWTGQGGQTAQVRLYTPSLDGTVLPDLPADIYGIKFNITGAPTAVAAQFDTAHAPTWGDFYACGGSPGPTAWNEGFTLIDPNDPPADGSILNHILVPGPSTDIPEPSFLALLVGGTFLCLRKRLG